MIAPARQQLLPVCAYLCCQAFAAKWLERSIWSPAKRQHHHQKGVLASFSTMLSADALMPEHTQPTPPSFICHQAPLTESNASLYLAMGVPEARDLFFKPEARIQRSSESDTQQMGSSEDSQELMDGVSPYAECILLAVFAHAV